MRLGEGGDRVGVGYSGVVKELNSGRLTALVTIISRMGTNSTIKLNDSFNLIILLEPILLS